jgi:hypothetical protein
VKQVKTSKHGKHARERLNVRLPHDTLLRIRELSDEPHRWVRAVVEQALGDGVTEPEK